ncbi:MAG: hypothetical protein OHK0039_19010 [Bacteroidia bacterium]
MIRRLHVLIPPFLRRIDQYLLLNKPDLWSTRIHYLTFFGGIALLLTALSAFIPASVSALPVAEAHFAFAWVPALILFAFWAWDLSLHRPEKYYGDSSPTRRFMLQGILLAGVTLFAALPFVYGVATAWRAQQAISDERLARDTETYLKGAFVFLDDVGMYNYDNLEVLAAWTEAYQAPSRMDFDMQPTTAEARAALRSDFIRVIDTYSGNSFSEADLFELSEGNDTYDQAYQVRYTLSNAFDAKRDWREGRHGFMEALKVDMDSPMMGVIFAIFLAWSLLLLFQHWGARPFFLFLLAGTGVIILSGLLTALADATDFADAEFFIPAIYFAALAIFTWQAYAPAGRRQAMFWRQSGLSLAVLMAPFLPLVLFLSAREADLLGFDDFEPGHIIIAGIAVATVLWHSIYQPRFLAMASQPRSN